MPRTTDVRKMCNAELFEVECDTSVVAKQKVREQHDSDRVRTEVIEQYEGSCVVMVYDTAQID